MYKFGNIPRSTRSSENTRLHGLMACRWLCGAGWMDLGSIVRIMCPGISPGTWLWQNLCPWKRVARARRPRWFQKLNRGCGITWEGIQVPVAASRRSRLAVDLTTITNSTANRNPRMKVAPKREGKWHTIIVWWPGAFPDQSSNRVSSELHFPHCLNFTVFAA